MSFNYPEKYWSKYVLADVCDYSKEKILTYEVTEKNYVSTENMQPDKGGVIEASNLPNSKNVVKYSKGDTLISNIRPYFKKIWIADKNGGASNDVLVFRCKSQKVIDKYLYYFLSQDKFFDYVMGSSKGTKMPRGDKDAIMKYTIYLPKLEEQKVIVNVLSTIDEKIQVNNQINKKLEKMAKAILKRWFIDFEFPDENGNPYKSSGGEMVESEMGMIPKGWKVGSFSDYTSNVLGGDWGKERQQGNYTKEVLCVRGADIPEIRNGSYGKMPQRFILEKNYSNKKLSDGDLVVEISGGSPTQSTGRITYINNTMLDKYNLDFVCTNFCRAVTLNNKIDMEYVYFYWTYLYDRDVFFQFENGTTGIKNFDINTFLDRYSIAIPSKNIIKSFHKNINLLLEKIQLNGMESSKLQTIRDILLPKLMSGEIRVTLDK